VALVVLHKPARPQDQEGQILLICGRTARRAKDEIAGPLRIVGPRSTFLPVLWPVLDEFTRRYPQVQPDLRCS
jgi:DNA-binding transcriptional LysR family regulator